MTSLKALYERYWTEQPGNGAPGAPPALDETLECLAGILAGGVLLDVGCGPGGVMAAARGRCRAVHGCDVSEVAARRARAAGVSAVCADLNEALPYRADVFDWVTCLEVIEHVVRRSWRRRTLVRLVGQHTFGEWMCGGIVALARKA